MNEYHQPLLPNHNYHIFSRAVGNEKLFYSSENYLFFLKKLKQHTNGVCRLYCYALLPNHFHLLVKINDERSIIHHFENIKKVTYIPKRHNLSQFTMKRFSNFLNSYAKSFNKIYNRKGALFMDYLKRSCAENDQEFSNFVWYIHKNAVHHRLAKFIGEWPFDSYRSILSDAPTALLRKEIIQFFGDKEAFIRFHEREIFPKDN